MFDFGKILKKYIRKKEYKKIEGIFFPYIPSKIEKMWEKKLYGFLDG